MGTTLTPNYNLIKPNIFEELDSWGGHVNANSDSIDSLIAGIELKTDFITVTKAVNLDTMDSKLAGIEDGADVTDTAKVTAAGALMDSELASEASVKALDQGVATTDSPTFAGLTTTGEATVHRLASNNSIFSVGYNTRTGVGGSYGANSFNFNWTGSSKLDAWVDSTNVGTVVMEDMAQTLTNKTPTAPFIQNGLAINYTGMPADNIDPANGLMQFKSLSGSTTFTSSLAQGESVVLLVVGNNFTITWPTMVWLSDGGSAPTLQAGGAITVVHLFRNDALLFGNALNGA